jgi:hypothetical protein
VSRKQWWKGLGWVPVLGLVAAGCGGAEVQEAAGTEEPGASLKSVEAAVDAACGSTPFTAQSLYEVSQDTYVSEEAPTVAYGSERKLVADGSPRREAYLRFSVNKLEPFTRAYVRLYVKDGSTNAPALSRIQYNTWQSSTVTWNTRPGLMGLPVANLGAVTSGTFVEYDVTEVIRGLGEYAFALTGEGGDGVDFASREALEPERRPVLVLEHPYTACSFRGPGGQVTRVSQLGNGAVDESLTALATDSLGGYVLVGGHGGGGTLGGDTFPAESGVMLGRFLADGTHVWSRHLPRTPGSFLGPTGVTLTPQGDILLVGMYSGTPSLGTAILPATAGSSGAFFAKLSPSGEVLWAKGFSASVTTPNGVQSRPLAARAVTTDAEGSLIVTGNLTGMTDLGGGTLSADAPGSPVPGNNPGPFIAKFSADGQHVWSHAYDGGTGSGMGTAVATDSAGNVLFGGALSQSQYGGDVLGATGNLNPVVAKYAPDGALQWARVLHGATGSVYGVGAGPGDAVTFAGQFQGQFSFQGQQRTSVGWTPDMGGWPDLMLGTLEPSGEDRRVNTVGTESAEYMRGAVVDAQGNVVVMGSSSKNTDLGGGAIGESWLEHQPFVASYAADGTHRGSRFLYTTFRPEALAVAPDGSALLGGSFTNGLWLDSQRYTTSAPRSDLLLLKLAP